MIRATHISGEVRNPFAKRRSVRSTARRLATFRSTALREATSVEEPGGQWPGKMTSSRPEVAFPEGQPHA